MQQEPINKKCQSKGTNKNNWKSYESAKVKTKCWMLVFLFWWSWRPINYLLECSIMNKEMINNTLKKSQNLYQQGSYPKMQKQTQVIQWSNRYKLDEHAHKSLEKDSNAHCKPNSNINVDGCNYQMNCVCCIITCSSQKRQLMA